MDSSMKHVKRVAAIHDMSGIGRCSLTVIMPVLSVMGVQCCPVPTAVLSSHSGGFGEFSFTDLTEGMNGYLNHWNEIGMHFDCIYTGFMGSAEQLDIILEYIDGQRDPLIVVDPVMGDNGRIYRTYTPAMCEKMKSLVAKADLITPNMTEACVLLDEPYRPGIDNLDEGKRLAERLSALGPSDVVITGVELPDGSRCNLAYSKDDFYMVKYSHIPVHFPGTGDLYTGVMIGAVMNGDSLATAVEFAAEYVAEAVGNTVEAGTPEREGVQFERNLGKLADYKDKEKKRRCKS